MNLEIVQCCCMEIRLRYKNAAFDPMKKNLLIFWQHQPPLRQQQQWPRIYTIKNATKAANNERFIQNDLRTNALRQIKTRKREERELMLDDQRFAAGDQWPMQIKRKREIEGGQFKQLTESLLLLTKLSVMRAK